jgi:hypothetical protein
METGLTVKNLQHHSWAIMVQEQTRSGLSIRDWCSQNNISTKTFYYRRKQVRSEILQAASPVFAELIPPEGDRVSSADGFRPQLTISIKDAVIGVDQGTPQQLLASVLEVMRNA